MVVTGHCRLPDTIARVAGSVHGAGVRGASIVRYDEKSNRVSTCA
eukprot:CAMPEP_0185207572 /NCGR_PEP_ID=MMETSP1140-20130426/60526_1 /TAXON_ID=298111 /ORGANISM="Pavlova sp., Strain CCMP459" /LENGTH=44 /DNA_ID= /DNA_START= /DNA_END= /DNA_ORIENTATION=